MSVVPRSSDWSAASTDHDKVVARMTSTKQGRSTLDFQGIECTTGVDSVEALLDQDGDH